MFRPSRVKPWCVMSSWNALKAIKSTLISFSLVEHAHTISRSVALPLSLRTTIIQVWICQEHQYNASRISFGFCILFFLIYFDLLVAKSLSLKLMYIQIIIEPIGLFECYKWTISAAFTRFSLNATFNLSSLLYI